MCIYVSTSVINEEIIKPKIEMKKEVKKIIICYFLFKISEAKIQLNNIDFVILPILFHRILCVLFNNTN